MTFADFLKWYDDLDVNPMIQAIEKMNDYYKNKNVDTLCTKPSLCLVLPRESV